MPQDDTTHEFQWSDLAATIEAMRLDQARALDQIEALATRAIEADDHRRAADAHRMNCAPDERRSAAASLRNLTRSADRAADRLIDRATGSNLERGGLDRLVARHVGEALNRWDVPEFLDRLRAARADLVEGR